MVEDEDQPRPRADGGQPMPESVSAPQMPEPRLPRSSRIEVGIGVVTVALQFIFPNAPIVGWLLLPIGLLLIFHGAWPILFTREFWDAVNRLYAFVVLVLVSSIWLAVDVAISSTQSHPQPASSNPATPTPQPPATAQAPQPTEPATKPPANPPSPPNPAPVPINVLAFDSLGVITVANPNASDVYITDLMSSYGSLATTMFRLNFSVAAYSTQSHRLTDSTIPWHSLDLRGKNYAEQLQMAVEDRKSVV
jgi:hypothetical protein